MDIGISSDNSVFSLAVDSSKCQVNDLPDEILQYILSLLRPYNDLRECMLVCKRWNKNALNVLQHTKSNFNRCIVNFTIKWEHHAPPDKGHSISKRYSHSACSYGNSMYVFGGCTCTSTTFNDLWRLDLSSRKWFRLLTMGTYPTPKALATVVYYEGLLVLFGGWTHPTPFPLHQAWRTFNELHVYDIAENRWSCVVTPLLSPPPMAGHSASVHRDEMVVFGGICGHTVTGSGNDIWCFNFLSQSWRKQETTNPKPVGRYNQSQIAIDEDHLLVLGGCGGRPSTLLCDVWLLSMRGDLWQWKEMAVVNPQWGTFHPSNNQLWCHPACKSGTNVITIGRNPSSTLPVFSLAKWNTRRHLTHDLNNLLPTRASDVGASPPIDRDVNVNGRRGSLTPRSSLANAEPSISNSPAVPKRQDQEVNVAKPHSDVPQRVFEMRLIAGERSRHPSPYSTNRNINLPMNNNMAAFRTNPTNTVNKHRERQLEVLNRMVEKLRNNSRNPPPEPPKEKPCMNLPAPRQSEPKMAMFVMDISNVLTDHSVKWLPIKGVPADGPEHTILYSLVPGQGEIIMFGGIQKDISDFCIDESSLNTCVNTVTNTLNFIIAPQTVI